MFGCPRAHAGPMAYIPFIIDQSRSPFQVFGLVVLVGFEACFGGVAWAEEPEEHQDDVDSTVLVRDQRLNAPDAQSTSAAVSSVVVDERIPASWDVGAAVDSVSGTTVTRLGGLGDFSSVSIRGSSTRQVQVHLEGIPLNPDGTSSVYLSELPLQAFERVDVYRGNAPPQLGAAPIGGVVNLVTSQRPGSAVYATGGSFNTARVGGSLNHSAWDGKLRTLVLVDAFHTQGDFSFFNDSGTRYTLIDDAVQERVNNDTDQLSALMRVQADLGLWQLTVMDSVMQREEGLPGHSGNRAFDARLEGFRNLGAVELERGLAQGQFRVRAWHQHRRETLLDLEGEVGAGTQHLSTLSQQLGVLSSASWVASPSMVASLTVWGRRDRGLTEDWLGDEAFPLHKRATYGAALSGDLWLLNERLRITPVVQGGLLDNRELQVEESDTPTPVPLQANFTPRIGALLQVQPNLVFKANAGRYFRPPDFGELYGDRGALLGNEALRPEQGWQADVGLRARSPDHWAVQGSVELGHFWQSSTDLITWVQNSQRTLVAQNIGQAWTQGVELSVQGDLAGWVDLQWNLTRMASVNLVPDPAVADNQLPRVPLWELSTQSSVHWGERVRVGHHWTYVAQNYWDSTNWYLSPPRSLHGAFVRVQPVDQGPSLECSVLNLQNRQVQSLPRNVLDPKDPSLILQPLTDFVGYPLPGRTVLLTLRWET